MVKLRGKTMYDAPGSNCAQAAFTALVGSEEDDPGRNCSRLNYMDKTGTPSPSPAAETLATAPTICLAELTGSNSET